MTAGIVNRIRNPIHSHLFFLILSKLLSLIPSSSFLILPFMVADPLRPEHRAVQGFA
jgi:hypothetical protein